jgi:hypothetical protein
MTLDLLDRWGAHKPPFSLRRSKSLRFNRSSKTARVCLQNQKALSWQQIDSGGITKRS